MTIPGGPAIPTSAKTVIDVATVEMRDLAGIAGGFMRILLSVFTIGTIGIAGSNAAAGILTLEEAIAGLYGSKPSDLHRLDDRTVEDKSGEQQFFRGDNNCTGGVRPTHWREGKEVCDSLSGECTHSSASLPDSAVVYREFHFDEVIPAQIHVEMLSDHHIKIEMPGSAYAHVGCSFFKSGKSYCNNSWSFDGGEPSDEDDQLLKQSSREIFRNLCPPKR